MPESGKTPEEHFIIQRRNLMIISAATLIYSLGGIEFTVLNFLGNKANIKSPEFIDYSILIVFIYLIWRYVIACSEISAFRNIIKDIKAISLFMSQKIAAKLVEKEHQIKFHEDFWLNNVETGADFGPTSKGKHAYIVHLKDPVSKRFASENIKIDDVTFGGVDLVWLYIKATLKSLLLRRPLTEFLLPFVFSFISIITFIFLSFH